MKIAALAVLVLGLIASAARAVDVTSCGQVVPANEVGTLTGSLDCSGAASGSKGVVLEQRASLALNGNSITSPPAGTSVSCDGTRCAVSGPGVLLSPYINPGVGISALKNVKVSGNIEINGNTVGISATGGRVTASDTFLSNSGDGIVAKKVNGRDLFVRDSTRVGIVAAKGVRGEHIEVRNSGWAGIQTSKFVITRFSATSNGMASTTIGGGIFATRRGLLIDSDVSGNALAGAPADLVTGRSPLLVNSSCSASVVLTDSGPGGTWGVCVTD